MLSLSRLGLRPRLFRSLVARQCNGTVWMKKKIQFKLLKANMTLLFNLQILKNYDKIFNEYNANLNTMYFMIIQFIIINK